MAEIPMAVEDHEPMESVSRERTPNIDDQRSERFRLEGQCSRKVYGRSRYAVPTVLTTMVSEDGPVTSFGLLKRGL